MKKKIRFKPILITVIILTAYFVVGYYLLDKLLGGMCGNQIIHKVNSPNGKKTAYILLRDCGATTGYSYNLTLFNSDENLPNKSGNTFVSDKSFNVKWINDKKLQVDYQNSSKTYEMDKSVNWTKIEYVGE